MQNTLKDGRLKFADKQKPCSEGETKTKTEALFIETMGIIVVDTVDNARAEDGKPNPKDQTEKAYPKDEEELFDFMNRCRLKDS